MSLSVSEGRFLTKSLALSVFASIHLFSAHHMVTDGIQALGPWSDLNQERKSGFSLKNQQFIAMQLP